MFHVSWSAHVLLHACTGITLHQPWLMQQKKLIKEISHHCEGVNDAKTFISLNKVVQGVVGLIELLNVLIIEKIAFCFVFCMDGNRQ